jgi:hypothetical protein
MSIYQTFVSISSFAFAVYILITIARDVFGKKDVVKTDEEVIDVSSLDEQPVVVPEDNGPLYEDEEVSDPVPVPVPSQVNDGGGMSFGIKQQSPDIVFYDPEHPEGMSEKEKLRGQQLEFEEVDTESTGAIEAADFKDMLLKSKPGDPQVRMRIDRI